jgi:transcriptional regulator with XRE-family HTH domain
MTLQPTHGTTVGARIKARRRFLGLSVRVVAARAGISHSHLSRLENGQCEASNRFHLARIAEALKCRTDHLTGVVVPVGSDAAETSAAVYAAVHAILTSDLEFPPAGPGSAGTEQQLTARVDDVVELRKACDYAALIRRVPALVADLYAATVGPHRQAALAGLVRVNEAASFAVRFTGDPRSATIASDRARQAALALGDPVLIAFGDWARAHAALGCGLHDRSAQITGKAIAELDRAGGDDTSGRLEMLGMLHLTYAFSLAGAGLLRDYSAPLAEARRLAARTGETDTLALMFGPLNLRLWELAITADAGDPNDALPIVEQVDPMRIASASRQCTFFIDAGRVMAALSNPDQAVRLLERAERIAPQRVHGDPIVVEHVRGLLDTVRRQAVGTRLRGLAQRVGVS